MTITLNAEKREKIGKTKGLRREGFLPAVFYGHKKEATPIKVKKIDFIKAWKNAGESTVIKLKTEEGDFDTLIKEVDIDPVTNEPRHADFYVFEKGHKVEISVPIEFEGTSRAVKELGAVLVKVMHEMKIKADPTNLPHTIKVNIESLVDFDSQITAGETKLPTGVELMENPDEIVAAVAKPKEEKEETAPVDLSTIEVEKKGKKEEEGETETSSS